MATVKNECQFYSQLDNDSDWNSGPWNECSYSSMAIYLGSIGYVGNGDGQFDDQIERQYEKQGYKRGAPYDMREFMQARCGARGCETNYDYQLTRKRLKEILDSGSVIIVHTWLTRSGHVAVLVGYDDAAYGGKGAWIVHDPNGEWSKDGYIPGSSGAYVLYSYGGSGQKLGRDGDIWGHYMTWGQDVTAA